MQPILFLVLALAGQATAPATQPSWTLRDNNHGKSYIRYIPGTEKSCNPTLDGLGDALAKAKKTELESPLSYLVLHSFLRDDPELQNELHAQFEKEHSESLKKALGSAGNVNNPALIDLRKAFPAALMKTETMETIIGILNRAGYEFSKLSYEKFYIKKAPGSQIYHAYVWLNFEPKKAEQTEEADAG